MPGGSCTRSESVLMNSPTMFSMPATSGGRPATVTRTPHPRAVAAQAGSPSRRKSIDGCVVEGAEGSQGLPQLYSPHYEQQEVIRVDPLSVYQFESLLGD